MTGTHISDLPETLVYAFCPSYAPEDEAQQILIVFDASPGYVGTEIGAPDLDQANDLCDRLNRALGHDREAWQRIAAASLTLERPAQSLN